MIADPIQDGSAPARPPTKQDTAAQAMRAFQLELLGLTLQRFIENIEGQSPGDDLLERESMHCCFSSTPLTIFRKGAHQFTNYFVWRGAHVLAHGFPDPRQPTVLVACRLTRDQWPPALAAYVSQHYKA